MKCTVTLEEEAGQTVGSRAHSSLAVHPMSALHPVSRFIHFGSFPHVAADLRSSTLQLGHPEQPKPQLCPKVLMAHPGPEALR